MRLGLYLECTGLVLYNLLVASMKNTICLFREMPILLVKQLVLKGGLLCFSWFHASKAFCARPSPQDNEIC